jgi:hypothetical protein
MFASWLFPVPHPLHIKSLATILFALITNKVSSCSDHHSSSTASITKYSYVTSSCPLCSYPLGVLPCWRSEICRLPTRRLCTRVRHLWPTPTPPTWTTTRQPLSAPPNQDSTQEMRYHTMSQSTLTVHTRAKTASGTWCSPRTLADTMKHPLEVVVGTCYNTSAEVGRCNFLQSFNSMLHV